MPARPRDHAPGAHHVWVKATGNWPYFIDELDRVRWIRLLEQVAGDHVWKVLAFCEMRTHVHALVHIPDLSLPVGMQYLNREYGKRFQLSSDFAFVDASLVLAELDGSLDALR